MSPLMIDQRSASLRLSPAEVREWANGRRVFVSSLITDMPEERAAARRAITDVGATPVMFEDDLGGQDISAAQAYLAGVQSADVYIGVWGPRYGVRMADGYSATEAEFRAAELLGLRLCLFVNGADSNEMDGAQRDLIDGARNAYTTSSWSSVRELEQRIAGRLTDLAAEEIAPWVRIGDVVIRANEISMDSATVTITAEIRSPQILQELARLMETRSEVPFASPTRAAHARVDTFRSTQRVHGLHIAELQLRLSDRRSAPMRMNMNGVPAEELAARALSDGLFSTSHIDDSFRWSGVKIIDPLAPLRGLGLNDVILRPVARLLIGQHLLTEGVAATVDAFVLGPNTSGGRTLRLSWTPPRVYVNEPAPATRWLEGVVRGL